MGNDGGEQHRLCGGLFGCGDTGGCGYRVEPDAVEATLTPGTRDRLDRMDELNQEALEPYVASYRVSRRRLVGGEAVARFAGGGRASEPPHRMLGTPGAQCGGHARRTHPRGRVYRGNRTPRYV